MIPSAPAAVDTDDVKDAATDRWAGALEVLRAHPDAHLNALDEAGLFVPLPEGMRGTGHAQLIGRSGIEAVEPADQGRGIEAWLCMLEQGMAAVEVRDRTNPLHLTCVIFIDLTELFGVYAAIAFPTSLRDAGAADAGRTPDDNAPRVGRIRKDLRAVLISADDNAERMLGYPPGGLTGMGARELVHPDDRGLAVAAWVGMLERPGCQERVRLRKRRRDGSWLWVDVVNHNLLHDPEYGCVVADMVDVSQEMAFREDVRARERLLQRLTQALPVGVVQLSPDGEVVYSNERLLEVLGNPARASLDEQLDTLRPGDRARLLTAFAASVRSRRDEDLQVEVLDATAHRVVEVALRPLVDEAGKVEGVLACLTDITESVRLRAELEQRATHDALTGCLNRGAILRRLREELTRVGPSYGCAVLFLDLDDFKQVNDTRGHAAGDEVLREVAAVLRSAARTGDAVGRLGGDEFVLICPRIDSAEQALALGVDVQARLGRSQPADLPQWGASTGVAWVDAPLLDAESLLGRADAAMYLAKQERGHSVVLWDGALAGQPR